MKRRFRILVALVMSLTMMFGMSITAFAEEYWHPDYVNQCGCGDTCQDAPLYYIAETNVTNDVPGDPYYGFQGVLTYLYTSSDGNFCGSAWFPNNGLFFQGVELVVGKVYHMDNSSNKYVLCDCNPDPYYPPSPSPSPSPEPNGETPSMTAEQIAEQRAEAEQKAVEEKIAEEKAFLVTEFTSESAINSMPAAAKSTGASANLSKITTMQGFSSAVTKLAASAKASITNRNGVASVTVYTDRPMTFSTDMLDAIYATDINFEYVFRYEGKLYKITIPRGVKVDLGESRYEGPLWVGKILGTTQVIE